MTAFSRRTEYDSSEEVKYKAMLKPIKENAETLKAPKVKSKKKLFIFLIPVTVLFITGIALQLLIFSKTPVSVPAEVRRAAGVSVVMPRKLPSGYSVNEQPVYNAELKLVLTRFTNKKGDFIALSQQPKPNDISLKQVDSQETYLDSIGTIYVLKGEVGRIQTIIETADLWVYVDGSKSVSLPVIKEFIRYLEPIK